MRLPEIVTNGVASVLLKGGVLGAPLGNERRGRYEGGGDTERTNKWRREEKENEKKTTGHCMGSTSKGGGRLPR